MSDYTTLADVKNALSATGTSFLDTDISRAITAASKAIDEACGRFFYAGTGQTRVYTATRRVGRYHAFSLTDSTLEIDDLTTLTTLKVDIDGDGTYETTWTRNTEFYLDPPNASVDSQPYERVILRAQNGACFPAWDNAIQIVGDFGWPSVPTEVTQYAVLFTTQLLLRTREAPFGVLMAGVEIGAMTRISRFDPDFDRLLGHLVKPHQLIA